MVGGTLGSSKSLGNLPLFPSFLGGITGMLPYFRDANPSFFQGFWGPRVVSKLVFRRFLW